VVRGSDGGEKHRVKKGDDDGSVATSLMFAWMWVKRWESERGQKWNERKLVGSPHGGRLEL
jgi:hypothetical protein